MRYEISGREMSTYKRPALRSGSLYEIISINPRYTFKNGEVFAIGDRVDLGKYGYCLSTGNLFDLTAFEKGDVHIRRLEPGEKVVVQNV